MGGDRIVILYNIGRVHQLLTRLYLPWPIGQFTDDPELGQRQLNRLTAPRAGHALHVQGEFISLQDIVLLLGYAQCL